jgi:hypothetical protein
LIDKANRIFRFLNAQKVVEMVEMARSNLNFLVDFEYFTNFPKREAKNEN